MIILESKASMNFRIVLNVSSSIIFMCGVAMLVCLIPAYLMHDPSYVITGFLKTSLFTLLTAACLFYKTRGEGKIGFREGFAVVVFVWLSVSAFGSLPFVWIQGMSWADAFFETMSGFTTTGASILSEIESLPYSLNFWRSFSNWLGGMGIVVLGMVILPILGVGGMQMYKAEATGPISEQLTSRVASTAKSLWLVYLGLTVLLIFLLHFAGMAWFPSICHAFSAMSTGGFSPKNDSITSYSYLIQLIMSVFMFISGINFVLHFKALRGQLKSYKEDEECRFYFKVIVISIAVITSNLLLTGTLDDAMEAFTLATFQVATFITCAGFSSANFDTWPALSKGFLILLMLVGSCGGSTCGGLKLSRVLLLIKHSLTQIKQCLFPHSLVNLKFNKTRVQDLVMGKILSFTFLYISVCVFFTIILLFIIPEIDLISAFTGTLTCLSNVGPGLNKVGPTANFGWMPDSAKWILSLVMLIGRLEIYTVLVLLLPDFWNK